MSSQVKKSSHDHGHSHIHMSHSFSYLSSLPLVTDPIAVASNDCARDRLHKDHCMQAFGRNTLSKLHNGVVRKIVGIAEQFPCYNYTVGPYGKGPTGDYTKCTYGS